MELRYSKALGIINTERNGSRGGYRPNAGRKPSPNKKAFRAIYVYREVFDAIPPGVNKCTLTSSLLSEWLKQNKAV